LGVVVGQRESKAFTRGGGGGGGGVECIVDACKQVKLVSAGIV
jgi:hypothetical protein